MSRRLARILGEPYHPSRAHISWDEYEANLAACKDWRAAHRFRGAIISSWYRAKRFAKDWRRVDRRAYYAIRNAVHRMRHGWAVPDTWSLDCYLARVIGETISHLRKVYHAYPNEITPEEYEEILDRISGPLLAYGSRDEPLEGESPSEWLARDTKLVHAAQDALRLMAEWFPTLWD